VSRGNNYRKNLNAKLNNSAKLALCKKLKDIRKKKIKTLQFKEYIIALVNLYYQTDKHLLVKITFVPI